MILAGNKCDMTDERKISKQEAEAKAREAGMHYYEVSAKENLLIDELFADLMEWVAKSRFGGGSQPEARTTVKLAP